MFATLSVASPVFDTFAFSSRTPQKNICGCPRIKAFRQKSLNKDGHLITEDSVLPTTAPGGAPEQNRCYQTPVTLLVLPPCARFARALGAPRTAHYATPPLGAGALVIALELEPKLARIFPLMTRASTSLCRRNQSSSETHGSSLLSDELREPNNSSFALDCLPSLRAGRVYKNC